MLSLDKTHGNLAIGLALTLALFASASLAGCVAGSGEPCDGDDCELDSPGDADQDEDVGEAAQAVDTCPGSHDVGVIPETLGCPAWSTLVKISMDDEDTTNNNNHSGWIGATISTGNTQFAFCRVNGEEFHPLSNGVPYAVLKLDETCPAGAKEFTRTFDNEDTSNSNSYTGNIYPNLSTVSPSQTKLVFCLFRGGGAGDMETWPVVSSGFKYGVFVREGVSPGLGDGFVLTDDEDTTNGNDYSTSWSQLLEQQVTVEARQIISDGSNTTLRMARVR